MFLAVSQLPLPPDSDSALSHWHASAGDRDRMTAFSKLRGQKGKSHSPFVPAFAPVESVMVVKW